MSSKSCNSRINFFFLYSMNNDERDENGSEESESDESGGDVCSSQAVLTFTLSAVTSRGERTDLSDLQL